MLLQRKTHQRMVVTLTTGDTYDGLYLGFDGVVLQLYQSALIGTDGQAIKSAAEVDGLLFLPWDRVAYCQCP